jgi:hypothetical protein
MKDKGEFELKYQMFFDIWMIKSPVSIAYIKNCIYPLKAKFVAAWTDELRHLGSTSTSRCEGIHAQVKKYIVSSREDLLKVGTALKLAL